jgi:ligand-binding SRPBCC domain-containing protein
MLYHLERSLFLPRPRKEVFSFFADADNLERITPRFLHFHILTPRPITIGAGTLIDYQLRLFGIPFRWRTLIETHEPVSSFTDVQLTGPYRRWHHRHTFSDAPGGTQMDDHVEYELPFGPMGRIARTLFVRGAVDRIFDYRSATIATIFSK